MDEAETWQRPHFPSHPLPAPRMGSAVPELGTFSGKSWESSLSPSPSGLQPRKAPWNSSSLCPLELWGSPGAALTFPRDAGEKGNTAGMEGKRGEGKSSSFPSRISGMGATPQMQPLPASHPQGCSSSFQPFSPRSRDASPAQIPGSEGGQEELRMLQARAWQGFVFIPDNRRGNWDLSANPALGVII